MPGWGLAGPLKSWVAWGWQLLAYTGIMRLWGYPDSPMETRCKIAWPDRVGSVTMVLGVLAALEYQARTAKGQFIEAGMLEAQGSMMGPAILDYTINRNEWDAMGYREILGEPYTPYGCYPCSGEDNWIIIACAGDEEWRRMIDVIGRKSWAADGKYARSPAAGRIAKSSIKNFHNGHGSTRPNRFSVYFKRQALQPVFRPPAKICFTTFTCASAATSSKPKPSPGAKSPITGCRESLRFQAQRRGPRRRSASITIKCSVRYWVGKRALQNSKKPKRSNSNITLRWAWGFHQPVSWLLMLSLLLHAGRWARG